MFKTLMSTAMIEASICILIEVEDSESEELVLSYDF